jgi:AcrR family transcriptional regulator
MPRRATTKDKIIAAALTMLRTQGYRGASARAIASAGKLNQALIFYHFGSVDAALLAALDRSSAARLARYRERFDGAGALLDLIDAAASLFREDVESGHVKVLAEMIAAGAASPDLGAQVAARVEPWMAFTRETFARLTAGSPLAGLISADDAAYALTSLYLGMELLNNLDSSHERSDALFSAASRIAMLFGALLAPQARGTS